MADVVVPLFWKSDSTRPVHLNGSLEFGRFLLDELVLNGQAYRLEPPVEIIESDGFLVEHGGNVWKLQQVTDDSLIVTTSFLVAEAANFLGLGINADASVSAGLTLRIPPVGTLPESFGTLDLCAHVDVDGGGATFCPDPICLSVNIPKLPLAPDSEGSPELWFKLPNIGVPVPSLPVPWIFPTIPLPVRWSAYSVNLRGVDIRVGWESLLLEVSGNGLKLVFERFQIDGLAGSIQADIVIAINRGGIDVPNSSIQLRRGPSIPLSGWQVGDGCFSLKWSGRQFGELLSLIAPGVGSSGLSADADIALRVLTFADAVSEIRIDVIPASASTLPIELPGFRVSLPGGKQFSLVYLAANGSVTAPANDTVFATMSLAAGQSVVAESTFTWTRSDDREVQNEGSGDLTGEDPLIKITATKIIADRTMSLLELPLGGRPRLLRQYDTLIPPLWNGAAPCEPTPWQTSSFDGSQWSIDFDFNDQLLNRFKMPFLNGETNGIGQYIKIKEPRFDPPDLSTSTVGGCVKVEVAVGPLKLLGQIGLLFNWETFAFDVDHGEGLDFVIEDNHEFSFLGMLWTFKTRPDGGPFFKLVTANSDYKLIQVEGSEIELRFTRATTEDQPIVFTVSDFEITEAGISLNAKVTEQPAKLNGLETEFRFKEGTFQIKENRILGFSIAGGGPLPPDLIGEANADIRLQFEQVGDSLELICGSAKVSGNKLAHCKGTRFEFSLDALGLEFVNDGAYHLYFLITGSAEYKPLDGDSSTGLLSYMPGIMIKLVDCPLTGNASVIAQHVEFKLKLPEPVGFDLFGCFAMEIRGFGFLPQCDKFGGDPAVIISGQVKFASGGGDVVSAQFDFHDLYVGLPKKGSLIPRFYMKGLGVAVKVGTSKVFGSVELVQDEEVAPRLIANGFKGTGGIEINGLPPMSATFAFLRVIRPEDGREVLAWFIYLEARRMSFKVPVIEVYLREVGLGLGYRYTLVGIKQADEVDDVKQLIKELKVISRTQANLADHSSWTVDIEPPGQKPKLTVALRALITQTSAAKGPFDWNQKKEEHLPCLFLLDAVIALRSDLTFFMVARGWLNTNYSDFNKSVDENKTLHKNPLISGFVLLSPRQKRFLAHVASNPGGEFGDHPPTLPFLKKAIKQSRFSATLLIEPGLVHAELGWPNMISWSDTLGPLKVEFRGGAILRTSTDELVTGLSYLATGSVSFRATASAGIVGITVTGTASVAYGARYIGVLDYQNLSRSAFYGGIGLEIKVRASVQGWAKFKKWGVKIEKSIGFDFDLNFTASLELGLLGDGSVGTRGSGTFKVNTPFRSVHVSASFSINDGAVSTARRITERFLGMGLEATEVDRVPGVETTLESEGFRRSSILNASGASLVSAVETLASGASGASHRRTILDEVVQHQQNLDEPEVLPPLAEEFLSPSYILFQKRTQHALYFTILPDGAAVPVDVADNDPRKGMVRDGFYSVPPQAGTVVQYDYVWKLPPVIPGTLVQWFDPGKSTEEGRWTFVSPNDKGQINWKLGWDQSFESEVPAESVEGETGTTNMTVERVFRTAFFAARDADAEEQLEEALDRLRLLRDPVQWPELSSEYDAEDERLKHPSDMAYEPAIRAAQEQFDTAPYFRHDVKRSHYDDLLSLAFDRRNELYSNNPPMQTVDARVVIEEPSRSDLDQQAIQMRGMLLQQMLVDFRSSVSTAETAEKHGTPEPDWKASFPGKAGVLFRIVAAWETSSRAEFLSRGLVGRLNAAGSGDTDAIDDIESTFNAQAGFPLGSNVSVHTESGTDWIVSGHVAAYRISDDGVNLFIARPISPTSLEYINQNKGSDWGTIWQRNQVDQGSPDITVEGRSVILFNDISRSFAARDATIDDVRTFEHENTIAISWRLKWNHSDTDLLERSLAYYAVTRRRLDDANSEIHFAVRDVDPLVRVPLNENQKKNAHNAAFGIQRIRSRFPIVDHFTPEPTGALMREIAYIYSITPISHDGIPGRTGTVIATRRPSTPPVVPADGRLEILFPCDSPGLFQPQSEARVHQPSRILFRWSEPEIPAGEPRIGIDKLRLVFRRNRTLPSGAYGVDSDARGNVQSGVPATNARKLRTDITFEWEATVGQQVQLTEENGRAVYYLILDIGELRKSGVVPGDQAWWRPEAWDIYLQAEGANGVRSSLVAVQIALQFAREAKIKEILARTNSNKENVLISENERNVENREVAQLEWFARPVVMPPLPENDADRETGWALVPQPIERLEDPGNESSKVFGKFPADDAIKFRPHPDRVRAIRFRLNQGPSGQQTPLDLHAGFRIVSFDALAHNPERLVPNQNDLTWERFTQQANLKTVQEIELVPASVLSMSPADTFTPRIWEAWYPSEQRRIALATKNAQENLTGDQKKRAPWYSWRESILVWPDPLTTKGKEINPNALFHREHDTAPIRWLRGRHALLDEILARVEYTVIDPPELGNEFPVAWGVTRASLLKELSIDDDNQLVDVPVPVELNKVVAGVGHAELDAFPRGTFVTVTEPDRRWRALRPDGTSVRIERIVKTASEQWRILLPIGRDGNPRQVPSLEVISQPWDASENLSAALNACEPESDPYGWNALQRLGLSVTFALRLPDQGIIVPASELMSRLKKAIEDACRQQPFDSGFKEHIHVEMLYRSDRRMEVRATESGPDLSSSEADLLSMVQVSLRPKTVKKLRYDVWTVKPLGMDVSSLRGKSVTLLVERATNTQCHLVMQPGTPGAEMSVPSGSGADAARVGITIPAEGCLRLFFRGTVDGMPTSVMCSDPNFPIKIEKTNENLPPWYPVSAHFNWIVLPEDDWLKNTHFRSYIEGLGATNEKDAHESFRFDFARLSDEDKRRIPTELQDWALRFFDYGGDVDVVEGSTEFGSGTRTDSSWFATAYPRTYSPALVAPDAERKIIYDHFVDDRWASAYRNLVVSDGRYDKLWAFVAGSTVLFNETALRNENAKKLDALPTLPDGGLDVTFPRIHPVSAPVVQLSSRLDEPSTPARPAPPGSVWEVILERHPEQVLKESNHHLQARLEFHDVIWTRFRRFRFSEQLVALQDVFFQRHVSWKVPSSDEPFLKLPDDVNLNPRLTFAVQGTTLINNQEVARHQSQIWRIRDLIIAALPESEREVIQVRIVTAADGQLVLIFIAQEDREIHLVDGNDAGRKLTVIENDSLHTISVRHVENQLDDTVALPLAPVHPNDPKEWKAQDWVERQGRIPVEGLSSDVRRLIDLPLRQDRIKGGAMVYQFDGIPYFYAQRLFFAARAGIEHSALTRLDHSDFHYVSPIPETNAAGLERDGDRYRQIEIALSRYWDCLESTARNRWPSEMPNEPGMSLSVSASGVFVGGQFGSVHRYDLGTKMLSGAIAVHQGRVVDLIAQETPGRLYCIGHDCTLKRLDLDTNPPAATHTVEFEVPVHCMALSNGTIAVGDSSGKLHTFAVDDLMRKEIRLVMAGDITALIGLPNGDWLLGGADGQITRVQADLSSQTDWADEHDGKVTAFAISNDGSKLCSVGEDALLVIWDVANETAILRVGHQGPSADGSSTMVPVPLTDVAISDDGSVVAIAGMDGNVFSGSIVDFATPKQIGDHATGRTCVNFVSAVSEFVSTGQDGTIQKLGKPLASLDAGTFSSLPDTGVVYQYTLVKPGKVIETISEIRFDSLQPYGFLARDIAVGYKTSVIKLNAPTSSDPRMRLITTLERDVKASATISFVTAGANSKASLTFEAKEAGATGSRIQIKFLKAPLGDSLLPSVSVADLQITVTLNTTSSSKSTVAKIIAAISANAAASELVSATLTGSADQDATYKSAPWTLSLGESVTQWVSSRQSFDDALVPAGVAFAVPHACRLQWAGALSILRSDENELREQIDELIAPATGFGVDASFREALLLLRKQEPDSLKEFLIPAPTDTSVRDRLFRSGRISLELVSLLNERGVSMKLRSWLEEIPTNTWLVHSGNRTHRLEVTANAITVNQIVRDNVSEASIGLEQLAELPAFVGVYQRNPTPKYRTALPRDQWNLKWLGAMSQTQFEILKREENGEAKGWTVTSDFRTSLLAMLQALVDHRVEIGFDGDHPDVAEIPAILRDRFEISDSPDGAATEHKISWTGMVLHRESLDGAIRCTDDEALQGLDDLHALNSGEQGFQDAIDALRRKLVGDVSEREAVTVLINDPQWFPRPNDDDLKTHFPELAKHLMVRAGIMTFTGVMTQAESEMLFEQAKSDLPLATSPDQRACEELFADAFNSGLDGARIEVRTRLGSAHMRSREVEAIIRREDEGF